VRQCLAASSSLRTISDYSCINHCVFVVSLSVLRLTCRGSFVLGRAIAIGLRLSVDCRSQRVKDQLWRTGGPSHC
jgi:hypothetical protein